MNGFGFFSLRYSVYELIAPHSVRVLSLKKKFLFLLRSLSLSFLGPFFFFWFWNSSQFLRQLVKIYRLQKNHSIGENKMVR